MKHMVPVKVLRSVDVSDDGLRVRRIEAGTENEVISDSFPGLKAEGYVIEAGAEMPVENIVGVALPEGWRDLHHLKLIAMAKNLDGSVSSKAEAIAVLEAYESAKA